MPKVVDHTERQEELIAAAIRVISRKGLDQTTTRDIALESGYSNGVLAHYFSDKDEILESTLRFSHRKIAARQKTLLAGRRGVAALHILILDNLPLDEERRVETLIEMSFWNRAVTNQALSRLQSEEAGKLLGRIAVVVAEARELGELDSPGSEAEIAESLVAMIDGLSVHGVLFPSRLPPESVKELMAAHLRALGFRLAE
jgi:AcrR family transcriptional regulator